MARKRIPTKEDQRINELCRKIHGIKKQLSNTEIFRVKCRLELNYGIAS